MKAYVIVGETGIYSEHEVWNVAVTLEKARAEAHLARLNHYLKSHDIPANCNRVYEGKEFNSQDKCPSTTDDLELQKRWQEHGVEYSIDEVEMLDGSSEGASDDTEPRQPLIPDRPQAKIGRG